MKIFTYKYPELTILESAKLSYEHAFNPYPDYSLQNEFYEQMYSETGTMFDHKKYKQKLDLLTEDTKFTQIKCIQKDIDEYIIYEEEIQNKQLDIRVGIDRTRGVSKECVWYMKFH